MQVNGTLINYFFHCKRQCYLFGNRMNFEDNSEDVKIGRAIHEEKSLNNDNTEINIGNVKIDKITKEYITEVKKSDADVEASKWQLIYYMYILKNKGIIRKGKLEFIEKNKQERKVIYIELTYEIEQQLLKYIKEVEILLSENFTPSVINSYKCKKCAYYSYCYI